MTRLLFVYGSLRSGQDNDAARVLHGAGQPLGAAHVRGHLVDVQGFPALVPGRAGRVDGELWRIDDEATWRELDAHEGVGEPGWYARGLVVAVDARGDTRSAWAYVAGPPATPA